MGGGRANYYTRPPGFLKEGNMGIKVKNMDIWMGAGMANALGQVRLPVKTSFEVAKLSNRLAEMRKPIEQVRKGLVDQFAEKDDKGKNKTHENGNVILSDPQCFQKAFDELMDLPCDKDVIEAKIKIPEKISGTCDKCHHNMDRALEIEPAILAALEPFIEVA